MDSTVIYGVNPVIEALCSDIKIEAVYIAIGLRSATRREIERVARHRNLRLLKTSKQELDGMTAGGVHQGVVAICEKSHYISFEELIEIEKKPKTVILVLDEIQDPRNLGALARSALAFGVTGMIIPARRAAGITPGAQKSSAGALAKLPVVKVKNLTTALEKLKKKGFWVTGAVLEDGQAPWEFDPSDKIALVMGSEGSGVRRGIEKILDYRVNIPISKESDSLNVSVAGAVLLYEWLVRKKIS
jgi:23S rRNA (guanosine2251-2'-O)-methyltransferase